MKGYYDTDAAFDALGHLEDVEELKNELLPMLQDQRRLWMDYIDALVKGSGRRVKEFADLCGVSTESLRKWRKEGALPQSRETFLRIGFAAGCDREGMDKLLRRYGRYPGLYVKSLEDCACIHVLQSETLPHDYKTYRRLVARMEQVLSESADPAEAAAGTEKMAASLAGVDSEEALMCFVRDNAAAYKAAYLKLYAMILQNLKANRLDDRLSGDGKLRTIQSLAGDQGWSSSLRHCISEIRSKRWYPTRSKIISLGLHLNMELDEIEELLVLARMEPLYVKNPAEAALYFALENAQLEGRICQDGETELLDYVRSVLSEVCLEDAEFLLEQL